MRLHFPGDMGLTENKSSPPRTQKGMQPHPKGEASPWIGRGRWKDSDSSAMGREAFPAGEPSEPSQDEGKQQPHESPHDPWRDVRQPGTHAVVDLAGIVDQLDDRS